MLWHCGHGRPEATKQRANVCDGLHDRNTVSELGIGAKVRPDPNMRKENSSKSKKRQRTVAIVETWKLGAELLASGFGRRTSVAK